ncbi:MAG: hypothetical protein ACK4NC_07490, partial [Candidatus Gracilibacteria bacterium]
MFAGGTLILTDSGITTIRQVADKEIRISAGHKWIPVVFESAGYSDNVYRSIQSLGFYTDVTLDEKILDCNASARSLYYFERPSVHRSTIKSYRLIHRQFVPSPDYGYEYPPKYLNLSQYDNSDPIIHHPLECHQEDVIKRVIEASRQSFSRRYWECCYILNNYAKIATSNRSGAVFVLFVPNITVARYIQLLFASCNLVIKIRPSLSILGSYIRDSYSLSGDFSRYRYPCLTFRIGCGDYLHITNPFVKDYFERSLHQKYTSTITKHYREFITQPLARRMEIPLAAKNGYRNHSYFHLVNPPSREAIPVVTYQEPLGYSCDVYYLRSAEKDKKIICALVGG